MVLTSGRTGQRASDAQCSAIVRRSHPVRTWDLDPSRIKLFHLRDQLEDIGTEEGNSWLGHIYNLLGFIQYKLGLTEDAQSLFNKAAEAFRQMRSADEGPWLVVNYGNLAWLNHHLGDQAESQAYLTKIDALMNKYPSLSHDELHPEIYAEKAWTLMNFSTDRNLAADYFQRAIKMQPDMVEWNTSHVLVLARAFKHSNTGLETDMIGEISISAAQSQTTLVSKLEALQCHFTWDLDPSRNKLFHLRDQLEDISTEEGDSWLGHIYNVRGFIQYKLGLTEDAQSLFKKAAEAFRQMRSADEGPWLVVNYGNVAWLNHHLGDQAESQAYLTKIDALINKYPSPSQDELHPEIYAEKAWTLMKFSTDKKVAADYFQRAIKMQPNMVEWNTSHVLVLARAFKDSNTGLEADMMEKVRIAKEQDPENLYLAAYYLEQCAKKGERIEDEARELARKVLRNPVSSYSGIKTLIMTYRNCVSIDEAIDLAEEALENHPDERYLKRCAALCYKWKIMFFSDSCPKQSMIDRGITLNKEVISL
ncbi:interferon-induced protein with tetratricopeptide repeats 1-like [Sebastes umbrosus]|uniref:interferon-induced protein with tetratricopeptide repeats 1-like n=1 Tax=Sebastes umbrosus TaxID=72105 RepID=UPI00189DED23|nr:interferon-induced protein with tetratricopeptide repeats 1-like [Sebastes umbrosus]